MKASTYKHGESCKYINAHVAGVCTRCLSLCVASCADSYSCSERCLHGYRRVPGPPAESQESDQRGSGTDNTASTLVKHVFLCGVEEVPLFSPLQEAEAFALYHKALDLQKHDKFEESARAYHELLKTPLLKEVKYWASGKSAVVLDDVCNTVHLQEMDSFTPAFCVSGAALR